MPVLVFGLSAAFVLYVLFGYPLWLALLARRRERPIHKRPETRTVSILLPVHNGEAWLDRKLRSILALDYPRHLMQMIVVSDGSDDGTEDIARQFAAQGVELVAIPRAGKAVAPNEGMRRARGEILFFTDVRQTLDAASLGNLVACFADPAVGVVSGELIIRRSGALEEENVGLYWRYEKWIRPRQSRIDSIMGASGCIYAKRAELAAPLPRGAILDDVHLPLRAFFRGYRIVWEAGARAYDYPTSIGSEFRRKVRTLAGVWQTIVAYPALLGWKNRMWLHFVSHKLGRLLLPWAMGLILLSSFGLPGIWRTVALGAHGVFYGLVLLDPLIAGALSAQAAQFSGARGVRADPDGVLRRGALVRARAGDRTDGKLNELGVSTAVRWQLEDLTRVYDLAAVGKVWLQERSPSAYLYGNPYRVQFELEVAPLVSVDRQHKR